MKTPALTGSVKNIDRHRTARRSLGNSSVLMGDRVKNRVAVFGPVMRWYDRPAMFSHIAVVLLLGLVAVNMLALAPVN